MYFHVTDALLSEKRKHGFSMLPIIWYICIRIATDYRKIAESFSLMIRKININLHELMQNI